jgi:D-alanyl-D-alanine dipeptidase
MNSQENLKSPASLHERIERSKSMERIDFSEIGCLDIVEPLVEMTPSEGIIIEPFWELKDDFEGERYADYIASHPEYTGVYIRPDLLSRVQAAAQSLDDRYKLVIRAAHRPIEVQRKLLIDCMKDYQINNPEVSEQEALDHARTFVSDPDLMSPPHCCGAAVDVDVFNTETNQYLDFGSKVNDDNQRSYLHYEGLTDKQKENRMILLSVMLDQGMASLASEWWHFSYGDQTWAWFYRQKNSLYGLIEPQFD